MHDIADGLVDGAASEHDTYVGLVAHDPSIGWVASAEVGGGDESMTRDLGYLGANLPPASSMEFDFTESRK